MKHTKAKLSAMICLTMLVAFAAIVLVFHLVLNQHVKQGAYEAIAQTQSSQLGAWDYKNTPYAVSWLYLKEGEDHTYEVEDPWYPQSPYTEGLMQWLSANQLAEGEIAHAKIEGRTYYLALQHVDFAEDGSTDPVLFTTPGLMVAYVDVTPEKQMITTVSVIIFVIMSLCSAFACLGGVLVGKRIEQDQQQQKEFFENASHELKTPLMIIQGYADGLAAGVISDETRAAEVMISETDKMAALIDEILSLSRLESGETKLHKEPVSLSALLNNCLGSVEVLAEKKGIHMVCEMDSGVVEADPAQLEKAVLNLLANAVRYAEQTIGVRYDGKSLVIWDDGAGVSPEDLHNIFKRFYTGQNGSTGIGLSLTKEIVERHGWKIRAENTEAGMQFVIDFKRTKPA